MDNIFALQFISGAALLFSITVFTSKLHSFSRLARPVDNAPARGSASKGVLYAFTLGMMPWSKEATRIHWVAYMRGVAFHLGIFLGLGLLIASPWLEIIPLPLRWFLAACAGLGCLFGLIGLISRFVEPNLKALSTKDDYFAVLIVSLYLGMAALATVQTAWLPLFYIFAIFMLVYAPFSKIRHCLYYAFSRLFFGKAMGRRGVLPHSQQELSHG